MAFSYDPTLYTALDRVRYALGDTVSPGLREDDTIEAKLIAAGTTLESIAINETAEGLATASLAEGLAMEFAQRPDSYSESTATGSISVSWRERVKGLMELAKRIREQLLITASVGASAVSSVAAERDGDPSSEYLREWPRWAWSDRDRTWYTN